jgi:predicted dehydrogenase
VGVEGLITKTWSRLREDRRNEKFVSCGVGTILEGPNDGPFRTGDTVCFIAPWHPALAERVVLPPHLVFTFDRAETLEIPENSIAYLPNKETRRDTAWWSPIRAWSVYAGTPLNIALKTELEKSLRTELGATEWSHATRYHAAHPTPVATTQGASPRDGRGTKTGILYGFGNYAKINIIPYSKPYVHIKTVHEIDPTQISISRGIERWESSPFPQLNEKADVWFVASYNHTHVPITLHALRQGGYVVVEKPVAMDYDELAELEATLRRTGRKLFIGFHKRYGLFNELARQDLGVPIGEPISYHSIVYELVQPELFWYNWPVSRSTFFANGCHQIDHFLHLNNFSKPRDAGIKLLQDDAVEVWIELENGATFTTTFSEKGVYRVGPRDFVELKVHNRNVRITDAIRYQSEDNQRIIRKVRIVKTNSYKAMYQTICKKIANNEPGDTIESVMVSTKLMLDLEEQLQKMKGWGDRYARAKEEFQKYFPK